jgi:SAM-dependent methyltransferase
MWIPPLPRRLRWDHNAYYGRWLLRLLPGRVATALDVGCGAGWLACALAERADRVDAVDRSAAMIRLARARPATGVRWVHGDVLSDDVPLADGYDLVTAVTCVHHMPLRPALRRLAGLVRPGGRLAVVGMYVPATPGDRLTAVVALPANGAMGLALAARGRAGKVYAPGMPVREATDTLPVISAAAAQIMPGALVRRRLFWRYTLLWRRPG